MTLFSLFDAEDLIFSCLFRARNCASVSPSLMARLNLGLRNDQINRGVTVLLMLPLGPGPPYIACLQFLL